MALRGLKVIEFAGLAPAPFCGMILADHGARVIRVDRTGAGSRDNLARGKQSIAVNLKKSEGVGVIKRLCKTADVLIEPFRAGVMEKLGLGPSELLTDNPGLVYARMTGFGQAGPMAPRAGHDINYLAISGVLGQLGRQHEKPYAPINLLADFAGGGLMCALGITLALLERRVSGKGQVIDANMVEGASYVGSFLWRSQNIPAVGKVRGTGMLDGGAHFYETYRTKDGQHMSVGAIEPQFYSRLIEGLGLDPDEASQFGDQEHSEAMFRRLTDIFASKTRAEWCEIFDDTDACVAPILSREEAPHHPHNVQHGSFLKNPVEEWYEPRAAPTLQRTPPVSEVLPQPEAGQHTTEILKELGYSTREVQDLIDQDAVEQGDVPSKL